MVLVLQCQKPIKYYKVKERSQIPISTYVFAYLPNSDTQYHVIRKRVNRYSFKDDGRKTSADNKFVVTGSQTVVLVCLKFVVIRLPGTAVHWNCWYVPPHTATNLVKCLKM